MADKNSLQNRRSLFTQSNQSKYYNQVFNDFNKYSQTLINRFAPPNKPGKSIDESSPSPTPSPTPAPVSSPTPSPTPAPVASITPGTYSVGDSALGGKIAYILQSGDPGYDANSEHGFVVNGTNLYNGIYAPSFGCIGSSFTGAAYSAIGKGNDNTSFILQECPSAIAAGITNNLVEGGYSDWYLPSKDELNKLYINRDLIGLGGQGVGIWSSTTDGFNNAWAQHFISGLQSSISRNDANVGGNAIIVRAIRSF
jgi:hypothetical protein